MAGGNAWDFIADSLKNLKLREVSANDKKEVWEIVQTLFTNFAESFSLQVVSKKANR